MTQGTASTEFARPTSPIAWIGWVLTGAVCLFVAENIWLDPWLRQRSHRLLSFVPEALSGLWFLVLGVLAVALLLAVICHVLLIKESGRPGWKKVLSGAAALTAVVMYIVWIAMTSGMAEGTWSAFHKRHHSVKLHWDASTTPNVVGYNIYRGTKKGTHEKKLNSVAVNGLTVTDTDVESGQTYYYVARAVNNVGKESIDSNETAATIP
jgi:hypothetical protein